MARKKKTLAQKLLKMAFKELATAGKKGGYNSWRSTEGKFKNTWKV
ncbi:hypothetical protein [Mesobacillus foraminis]|nr:hypothetical protein [Mesobacillus foraminis]